MVERLCISRTERRLRAVSLWSLGKRRLAGYAAASVLPRNTQYINLVYDVGDGSELQEYFRHRYAGLVRQLVELELIEAESEVQTILGR